MSDDIWILWYDQNGGNIDEFKFRKCPQKDVGSLQSRVKKMENGNKNMEHEETVAQVTKKWVKLNGKEWPPNRGLGTFCCD